MRRLTCCLLLVGVGLPVAGHLPGAGPPVPGRLDGLGDPLPARAFARLGTSRFRPGIPARQAVALSPDGRTLAVPGPGRGPVTLVDVVTGRVVRRLAACAADGLAFLARGKELACADAGTVAFWDLDRGKQVRQVTVKAGERGFAALAADGSLLATAGRGERRAPLSLYDARTGRHVSKLEAGTAQASAALSPDGKWLATWAGAADAMRGGRGRGGRGGRGGGLPGGGDEEPARPSSQEVQVWDP